MFKKIFIKLCSERGESPSFVCGKIGISPAAFSQWSDDTIPRKVTQQKTAEYFGVSVDYLLGKEDISPQEPMQTLTQLDAERIYSIPLFESASAGFGSYAINEIVDYVPLYFTNATEAAETICIRVRGDSMSPKIENGDIIQVRKQDEVANGSIAVVLLDGDEGLVKHVLYGDGWIELRSLNPFYKPMRFNGPDALRVRPVGLVTKIIKNVSGQVHELPSPAPISEKKQALLDLLDQLDEDQLKQVNAYIDFIAKRGE
jgi:repressor LexA